MTPTKLELKLWVNGALKQHADTGEMIWSIEEQIVELSRHMTIRPGHILFTGSPAGRFCHAIIYDGRRPNNGGNHWIGEPEFRYHPRK